jgi:hypothetical protein
MEIWKDIPNYEGIYQVSNFGNVKSFNYNQEKILRQNIDLPGYLYVNLSKNGKVKNSKIHKLVALTFLNHKAQGYKIVIDHIDNNKLNNNLSNIQIISQRLNTSKDKKSATSKYTGVYWCKKRNKWKASIQIKGKQKYLGLFSCEILASNAYQLAVKTI